MSSKSKQLPRYIERLVHDIVKVLLTYQPIKKGQRIEITLDGALSASNNNIVDIKDTLKEIGYSFDHLPEQDQPNWTQWKLFQYLEEAFRGVIKLEMNAYERFIPPKFKLSFIVLSPRKLLTFAKRLSGTSKKEVKNNLSYIPVSPAKTATNPYLHEERGYGFLLLEKRPDTKIRIGKLDSRPYRLLRCLFEPKIGITKTLDTVFEGLRTERDKTNSDLLNGSLATHQKQSIIKDARRKIYSTLKAGGQKGLLKIHIKPKECRIESMV